jgi:periplasmic protein TonB
VTSGWWLMFGVSAGVHVAGLLATPTDAPARPRVDAPPPEVSVELAPPPPPVPTNEPEVEPAVDPEPDTKRPPIDTPQATPPRATPARTEPAQAGRTLTAPSDGPSDPVDFTVPQGAADATYSGGTTTSGGKGTNPGTREPGTDAPGPSGPPVAAKPDLSKRAAPSSGSWSCSRLFPPDATVNVASVTIVVLVSAEGRATSVQVVSDPGGGFGSAAKTCAMGQTYKPGLDREGRPTATQTAPFAVRFTR